MRWQFCGFENPSGSTVCSKCNHPLIGGAGNMNSTIREEVAAHEQKTQLKSADYNRTPSDGSSSFNPKATMRESAQSVENEPLDNKVYQCDECGYELDEVNGICPSCGKQHGKVEEQLMTPDFKKTKRPQHRSRFHTEEKGVNFNLSLVSDDGERLFTTNYVGEEVVLNRDNTEKDNATITSQKQATVKYVDGEWMIVDNSEMKSTFVQASHPIKLNHGDYILLGDRIFRFELE